MNIFVEDIVMLACTNSLHRGIDGTGNQAGKPELSVLLTRLP